MKLSFRRRLITTFAVLLAIFLFSSRNNSPVGSFRANRTVEKGTEGLQSATAGNHRFFVNGQYDSVDPGLGHSFIAFHALVVFSSQHNLTPHFPFTCTGHGLNGERTKAYFFGDLIQARNNITKCGTLSTSRDTLEMDLAAHKLSLAEGARNETNSSSSASQHACTLLVVRDMFGIADGDVAMDSHLPYYRSLFESNDMARQSIIKRKVFAGIKIALHIRRGDLFAYLKNKENDRENQRLAAQQRLVPLAVYKSALEHVLVKLRLHGHADIHIEIFCESWNGKNILDIDGTFVDFGSSIIYDRSVQNVTFGQGSDDTIQAFDDMCFSDIFITGTSLLSYLVSLLCAKPVVLALPFFYSYEYIPNALQVEATRTNFALPKIASNFSVPLIGRIDINDTQFDDLWRERKAANRED